MGHRTHVKKPFLHGTTPRISFQIVDPDGVGFQPDTLTMSVYDYVDTEDPPADQLVNDRNDVDILDFCDADGNVAFYLEAEDTELVVPASELAIQPKRRLLFTWTWDSPVKVGKHELILTIAPDRETVAN